MAEKIVMPQLGESIAEGTIVKWLKKPGDAVEKDENVLLISTDKVEAEIPSPASGVLLSIDVDAGKTVPVGTLLGYVGKAEEMGKAAGGKGEAAGAADASTQPTQNAPAQKQPISAPKQTPPPSAPPAQAPAPPAQAYAAPSSQSSFISPLVRKIASENNVSDQEIQSLGGSGREGRVTKNDILDYLQTRGSKPAPSAAPAAAASGSAGAPRGAPQIMPKAPAAPTGGPTIQFPPGEREVIKPVSTMRRVIMENMVASRRTSAHVTTFFEVDYTAIDTIRHAYKDRFRQEEGVSLTYTVFLAAAVCQVLKRHPYINAKIEEGQIRFRSDVHLGIAVAIDEPEPGLMVPVIRNADQMNLRGLGRAIHDVGTRTRGRRIKPDELSGGSFTITNPGSYGAIIGTPIINQPQVAILGVGAIKKEPVVMELGGTDVIAIRNRGLLSLSFDHRLIDGVTADKFMADLKYVLENWTTAP